MTPVQLSDRQIVALRGPKTVLDPARAYAAVLEEERDAHGDIVPTATLFLTNRECPFRCVMCDLWVNTLDDTVADGLIPEQIRTALAGLPAARQVKLYNAGSFFDAQAIPPADDEEIARLVGSYDRVIVESHPAYLRGPYAERCRRFRDRLGGRLEVAVGLETAHAGVLQRLNKRMTVDDFVAAAAFLRANDIDVRAFVLLQPPFMPAEDAVEWACRSLDAAFDAGAHVCSVIPTRGGNGAMEAVTATRPPLTALESVIEYGVAIDRGRVFADLWDIDRFCDCRCSPHRVERLRLMNRVQRIPPPILCDCTADR